MTIPEESALAQLGVSDILMPAQYYDALRRDNPETQAIKRLMFAVLADAVRRFQTYVDARSTAGGRMFGEAERWILDRNGDGPFTFHAICETLGIEPNSLRDGLRQWRVQQLSGMNPRRLTQRSAVTNARLVPSPIRRTRRRMNERTCRVQ